MCHGKICNYFKIIILISSIFQVLQILCVIKHYRVGTLSENCLELFLKHIDQIYSKHYMKNDIMLQILDILSCKIEYIYILCGNLKLFFICILDVYEQVKDSSLVIKSNAVNLLLPFFTKRIDYGPEYSVAITKCLSVLAKVCKYFLSLIICSTSTFSIICS